MTAVNLHAAPPLALGPSSPAANTAPILIGKMPAEGSQVMQLLPWPVPPTGDKPTHWPPIERPPVGLPPLDPPIGRLLPPFDPPIDRPLPPGCGCQQDDTREYRIGCFGPQAINLDSGRNGPDDIHVTVHEDGSSTVRINGCEYNYDADETSRLSIGVDGNDNYTVQDNRSALQKLANPMPVKIYTP